MLAQPEQSLAKQSIVWTDLKGTYRLFDTKYVTSDAVAEQHWQQARQTDTGRYLLINDTADIDHFSRSATTGLSQLGKGDDRGMQLRSCVVYSCDQKQISGTAGALIHYRPSRCERRNADAAPQPLVKAGCGAIWLITSVLRRKIVSGLTSLIAAATTSKRCATSAWRVPWPQARREPVWQTIWHGYKRLTALLDGMRLADAI